MSRVARYDISVGDDIGSVDVIPAGKAIPSKYADRVKEWEARGLIGDEAATDANERVSPLTLPQELTQEEVDAGEEKFARIHKHREVTQDEVEERLPVATVRDATDGGKPIEDATEVAAEVPDAPVPEAKTARKTAK